MEVDKSSSDSGAAQRIAQKRQQIEEEEKKLSSEMGRLQREHKKTIETIKERNDGEIVEISRQGTNQVEAFRKLNSDRLTNMNADVQKKHIVLAEKTADEIRRTENDALKAVENSKLNSMGRIKAVTNRNEDPFYQLKSLNPVLSESEKEYSIQIKLPPHEAENLYVSAEGPFVKVALTRRFKDDVNSPEGGRKTSTSSFQSVVEQVGIPGAFDAKKIERLYKDGKVTIRIPKHIPEIKDPSSAS